MRVEGGGPGGGGEGRQEKERRLVLTECCLLGLPCRNPPRLCRSTSCLCCHSREKCVVSPPFCVGTAELT